ncbi:MAG: aminotransferase class V-fold PLP-dependent enzyme [Thermoplasmata archaeon]
MTALDPRALRTKFPALRPRRGRKVPSYLDSACMTLTPQPVLDAMIEYYRDFPGCAGRSLHRNAEEVAHRFAAAREGFARFLGAAGPENVVFLRNATEAINLVGQGIAWKKGDRVLITDQEHNSNLVLWQRLRDTRGIRLDVLPLPDHGGFDADALERALAPGVRLVSMVHTSNLDGRSLPAGEIVERAHAHGALVLFDGCQAAPHQRVDLGRLGADFYAVSAHKMLGPTGTGVLLGAPDPLAELEPLVVGGETVEWTTLESHQLRPPPHRFEAGLQNYAGVLGAHAGIRFLESVGVDEAREHDLELNERVTRALSDEPRVHLLGPKEARERPSIFAFHLDGIDPHDAALFLDEGWNVLLRSGMHCVHSWYAKRGLTGNVRASFYLYNDRRDVDRFVEGVRELLERVPGSAGAGRSDERLTGTSASTGSA